MPRLNGKLPALRHHKARNLAVVSLNGVDHYLGPWGSDASRAEYDRLIAAWLAAGRQPILRPGQAGDLRVVELLARFWAHATAHYQRDGRPTREIDSLRVALKPLKEQYGHTPAAEFGPARYKALRASMVAAGLCRRTVHIRLGKVKRVFRWAVSEELVPADTYHRLQAVPPLRPGRDGVRESEPVQPVPAEHIDAALPFLQPTVRAMVEFQRLTGCRPAEVMGLTTGAIDRSGELWIYRPARHKGQWRGRDRQIVIGPRAQAVITPLLKEDPAAAVFSPRRSMEQHQSRRRTARRTPMTPSQRARKPRAMPRRPAGEFYGVYSYSGAVRRACLKAGVPPWSPSRLRHTAATEIRKRFGLEAAQVVLGHSRADVTQIYAQADVAQAVAVMRHVG